MKPILYLCGIALLLASCNSGSNNMSSSSNDKITKNEQGMQRFYDEVMNKHDVSKIDSFVAPNILDHQTMSGKPESMTSDSLKKILQKLFTMYPDLHVTVNFMLADSDKVMAEVTQTGTNTGTTMMGSPATNKSVNFNGVDIVKLKDGKATEHWGYEEDMKEMMQLGMMPPMGNDSTMMKKDMKKGMKKK